MPFFLPSVLQPHGQADADLFNGNILYVLHIMNSNQLTKFPNGSLHRGLFAFEFAQMAADLVTEAHTTVEYELEHLADMLLSLQLRLDEYLTPPSNEYDIQHDWMDINELFRTITQLTDIMKSLDQLLCLRDGQPTSRPARYTGGEMMEMPTNPLPPRPEWVWNALPESATYAERVKDRLIEEAHLARTYYLYYSSFVSRYPLQHQTQLSEYVWDNDPSSPYKPYEMLDRSVQYAEQRAREFVESERFLSGMNAPFVTSRTEMKSYLIRVVIRQQETVDGQTLFKTKPFLMGLMAPDLLHAQGVLWSHIFTQQRFDAEGNPYRVDTAYPVSHNPETGQASPDYPHDDFVLFCYQMGNGNRTVQGPRFTDYNGIRDFPISMQRTVSNAEPSPIVKDFLWEMQVWDMRADKLIYQHNSVRPRP